MLADVALKTGNSSLLNGDNDNNSGAVLTQKEINPLAHEGARRLISYHSARTPVVIKSWGSPDVVYDDIRESLVNFGYDIGMAEDMAQKLVEHAESHAESSRAKYGAKIIALKIEVSKEKPQTQFETGALESQRITVNSTKAQVAGATSVAVGIDTGGTTTTALRDSVGEIMNAIAGEQAVWIDFEAPNKSELKGVANDAALSAMAQMAGGALAPEQVEVLMAEIQNFVELELITPEIFNVVQNLNQIQAQTADGNFEGLKVLSQAIIKDLSIVMESIDVPAEILVSVTDVLKDLATQNLPLDQKLEILAELGAQDFKDIIIELKGMEDLPETLVDVLDQIDIENLSLDELKDALAGKGAPAVIEAVQQIIITLNNPEIQAAMPQIALDQVNQFLSAQASLVDAVTANIIVNDLSAAIIELDGSSLETVKLQEVIERLESGESLDTVDPSIMETIVESLGNKAPPQIFQVIERIKNIQTNNVVVGIETIESLKSLVQAGSLNSTAKDILNEILENPETLHQNNLERIVEILGSEVPVEIVKLSNSEAPKLSEATRLHLEALTYSEVLPDAKKEAIQSYLNNPDNAVALKVVQTELGKEAPPQVVEAFSRPIPPVEMASQLQTIKQNVLLPTSSNKPLSAADKVPVEALNSAIKTLQKLPANQQISAAQAEVLLRKIDEGRTIVTDPKINQQIDLLREKIIESTVDKGKAIPEEVKTGGCPGCGGGNCASCGGDHKAAAAEASDMNDRMKYKSAGNDNKIIHIHVETQNNVKTETSVQGGALTEASALKVAIDALNNERGAKLTAAEKVPIEALKSVIKSVEQFEASGGEEKFSAEKAEVMLRKINEGLLSVQDSTIYAQLEQLREQIIVSTVDKGEAIPEEVKTGGCAGCGGGNCASCGGDHKAAVTEAADMTIYTSYKSAPRAVNQ